MARKQTDKRYYHETKKPFKSRLEECFDSVKPPYRFTDFAMI